MKNRYCLFYIYGNSMIIFEPEMYDKELGCMVQPDLWTVKRA
ncbi:hypothetical protein [Clostridium ragsdalei]|nr:hypothetical protein [Clostridium ragsdalei]